MPHFGNGIQPIGRGKEFATDKSRLPINLGDGLHKVEIASQLNLGFVLHSAKLQYRFSQQAKPPSKQSLPQNESKLQGFSAAELGSYLPVELGLRASPGGAPAPVRAALQHQEAVRIRLERQAFQHQLDDPQSPARTSTGIATAHADNCGREKAMSLRDAAKDQI